MTTGQEAALEAVLEMLRDIWAEIENEEATAMVGEYHEQ